MLKVIKFTATIETVDIIDHTYDINGRNSGIFSRNFRNQNSTAVLKLSGVDTFATLNLYKK